MPDSIPNFRPNKKKRETYRGSAAKRGYGYAWQKYAADVLRESPLCVICLAKGLTVAAVCVDHIQPKGADERGEEADRSNLQTLCHSCHSEKTVREDGGLGHKRKG